MRPPSRAILRYNEPVVLTLLLLALVDPHADAKIVWNKAGTWGAYTVDLMDGGTRSGFNNSIALYAVSKDRKTRKHLFTGRYMDQRVTELSGDLYVYPSIHMWAPDDVHLIFFKIHAERSGSYGNSGSPLFDANVMTGKVRKLSMPYKQENGYLDDRIGYDRSIAFSPDGTKLLLTMGGRSIWSGRIALLDYTTLRRTWLTDYTVAANSPSWSPGGKRVVYCACPMQLPKAVAEELVGSYREYMARYELRRIWIANSDGTARRQLTNESDSYPIWRSKDVIEFIRGEDEVWSMRPDGSAQKFVRKLGNESNFWRYEAYD